MTDGFNEQYELIFLYAIKKQVDKSECFCRLRLGN